MSERADYQAAVALLKNAERIALARHLSPDGDAIGAQIGLALALRAMGKSVDLLRQDPVPPHLQYLPALEALPPVDGDAPYDLFVLLDLGDRRRMGDAVQIMERTATSLCIDHHRTNERLCSVNWVRPAASSTCEMVAELLLKEGWPLPSEAATALFAGLVTDSNRFLYETARAQALRTGAALLDHGADASLVYFHEYQNMDAQLIALQGYVVKTATYLAEGRIVLANLTEDLLRRFHLRMEEAESVVDVLKNLKGVEIAVIVKDHAPEVQKVSFRSKRFFNVAQLAMRYGGGGHTQAAGCRLLQSNEETMAEMKQLLEQIPCEQLSMESST